MVVLGKKMMPLRLVNQLKLIIKRRRKYITKIYKQREIDYESIEKLPGKSFENLQIELNLDLAPPLINFMIVLNILNLT